MERYSRAQCVLLLKMIDWTCRIGSIRPINYGSSNHNILALRGDLSPKLLIMKHLTLLSLAFLSLCASLTADIHIQAEGFAEVGGWVVDAQFMDQMGSPYLLAHGLGKPVKDAVTTISVPVTSKYRVWVRTYNWTARWKAPGAPGRFQVLFNGESAPQTFGTVGEKWHWQDGGVLELAKGDCEVRLKDLTGFAGRCDAIWLSQDLVRSIFPFSEKLLFSKMERMLMMRLWGSMIWSLWEEVLLEPVLRFGHLNKT